VKVALPPQVKLCALVWISINTKIIGISRMKYLIIFMGVIGGIGETLELQHQRSIGCNISRRETSAAM